MRWTSTSVAILCRAALAGAAVGLLAGCPGKPGAKAPQGLARGDGAAPVPLPGIGAKWPVRSTLKAVGLDPGSIDDKVDPCDDFYQFACGGYIARTEIPPDRSRYGRTTEIVDRNEADLHAILEQASASVAAGTATDAPTRAIGTFYRACMDEASVEKAGTRPIDDLLQRVRKAGDLEAITSLVAALHERGIWALFRLSSDADYKEATRAILYLGQGGLGLPDRDYYLDATPPMKELRTSYRAHVERMFRLLGESASSARRAAADVLRIETALAKASRPRDELEDPVNSYNKIDRAGLEKLTPRFPWHDELAALGQPELHDVSVDAPGFLTGMNRLLTAEKPAAWRSYLAWQIASASADALPKRFVDEDFVLARLLTGAPENQPRWKRCVAATDDALGEYLAQPFVAARFGGDSKDAADRMVREISQAFAGVVKELDWMSAETRQRALEKLSAMAHLVGYPKKWRTYDVALGPVYASNRLAAQRLDVLRELAKVGQPFDRDEWGMTPPTVNAYYTPLANQMVFPAGILQPPLFAVASHTAVNLGAIGMVVGHELTHGFDASGAKFDADGNMASWWQPEDAAHFDERGACVVDQYSAYSPLPGLTVNGKLTLNENIADLGGIKLAFRAYRAMQADARTVTEADGYDEDQLFFLAVGQSWCSRSRDEEVRRRILVDTHSPPRFRVNGPLSALPAFHDAFHCAAGKPMHPAHTCTVW